MTGGLSGSPRHDAGLLHELVVVTRTQQLNCRHSYLQPTTTGSVVSWQCLALRLVGCGFDHVVLALHTTHWLHASGFGDGIGGVRSPNDCPARRHGSPPLRRGMMGPRLSGRDNPCDFLTKDVTKLRAECCFPNQECFPFGQPMFGNGSAG